MVYYALLLWDYTNLKLKESGKGIEERPDPENVKHLRSFLGMVQYYSHCLPDLATCLAPLNRKLWIGNGKKRRRKALRWSTRRRCCYKTVHFDSDRRVHLACNSSSVDWLQSSHTKDAWLQCSFVYPSLSKPKNFAHIEKEALGMKEDFKLLADRKPLKFCCS